MVKNLFLFPLLTASIFCCAQLKRIPLKVSESFANNPVSQTTQFLIDDNPNTRYHPTYPGYNSIIKPFRTTFLLSDYSPCTIKRIVYFDSNGDHYNCRFILVRADNGKEVELFTFTGDQYLVSDTFEVPKDKQFAASKLILETPSGGDGYPNDMQLWGSFTERKSSINTKHYPIKNFLGANLHPWDMDSVQYPAKYKAIIDLRTTMLRLYSDASADKDSATGAYTLNPERRGFYVERSFASLKKDAPWIRSHICYQNQSLPIKATWTAAGKKSHLDFPYGSDRNDPLTYSEIAKDAYVLATRGGKNKNLPDYPVYIPSRSWERAQQLIKGGGFYDIIEGGNEWNAWWAGLDGYLSGPQLGVAWSAIYDGYKGLIKNGGAKNADKNITVTNGGVATDKPDMLFEIIEWAKKERGYKTNGKIDLPFDVYQFHCYPSSEGQYSNSSGGLPPELGMIPRTEAIVKVANKYADQVPVLIGEWGYDVHPKSTQNAPAYSTYTAEQSRAHLAIRAILGFAQAGAWAAEWYRLYQDWPNRIYDSVGEQFATMALLRQMDDSAKIIKRTLVGDYFKQLSHFGDFVFDEAVRNDSVRVLKFKNGTKYLYAIWAVENVSINTKTNRPVYIERKGDFTLDKKGKLYQFTDEGNGVMSVENFKGGTVKYCAKPVFILVDE